jgi:hypothetical protein
MTREKKDKYQEPETLRRMLERLNGMKFRLDCGHHVTFGYNLGNDVAILNGGAGKMKFVCLDCGA